MDSESELGRQGLQLLSKFSAWRLTMVNEEQAPPFWHKNVNVTNGECGIL